MEKYDSTSFRCDKGVEPIRSQNITARWRRSLIAVSGARFG